jgi:hypothetical protein
MFATRLMQLIFLSAAVVAVMVIVTGTGEHAKETQSGTFAITDFLRGSDAQDFAQVTGAREFHFPADHGSHDTYRSEWWYFTGNTEDASGRQFGYQLTFFRFSPTAQIESGQSRWRSNQFYMAHLAVTDIKKNAFIRLNVSAVQPRVWPGQIRMACTYGWMIGQSQLNQILAYHYEYVQRRDRSPLS